MWVWNKFLCISHLIHPIFFYQTKHKQGFEVEGATVTRVDSGHFNSYQFLKSWSFYISELWRKVEWYWCQMLEIISTSTMKNRKKKNHENLTV